MGTAIEYYFDKSQATIIVYCNDIELFREFKRGRKIIRKRMREICKCLAGTNSYIHIKYLTFTKDLVKERERWAVRALKKKL